MELIELYVVMFGDLPSKPYGYTYKDEKVVEKIKEAIDRGKPLTLDDYKGWKQEGVYDRSKEEK